MIFLVFSLLISYFGFSFASNDLQPNIVTPLGYNWLRKSNQSTLYKINLPNTRWGYVDPPYLLVLRGSRYQIGYDYATLLHDESLMTLQNFLGALFNFEEQVMITMFLDYCWNTILSKYTPPEFLEELRGMKDAYQPINPGGITVDMVASRFYTLANMPADPGMMIYFILC
jgi:hypothetical protein